MIVRRYPFAVAAVAAAGILTLSCGDSPASSTPPVTVTPSPTPPPGSGQPPVASSCPLGKGVEVHTCDRGKSSKLLPEVEAAMNELIQQKPQIFDLNDEYAPDTKAYKVLDREAYLNGLVANLQSAGLCAERDVDDAYLETIRAKKTNDYSEDFDVFLSSGHMRRGIGAYRTTCTPASFPLDRPDDAPPIGSGCGRPYPPPITRFSCKVHLKGENYYTLDSTPKVGPDCAYCESIGFSGQCICALRPEGAPDRVACENWRVGKAKDTGRYGPTWTKEDGSYCTGLETSGCVNSADNQYQLWAAAGGKYKVQAENGASCDVTVER